MEENNSIELEIVPIKKIYDDKDTYNKGYKVYSVEVPEQYRRLVGFKSKIVISGICLELKIGKTYILLCNEILDGKYQGGYKIERIVFEEILNGDKNYAILSYLEYAESTINNILTVFPNICDLILENKTIDRSIKIKGFNEERFNNLISKVKKNSKELYLILNFPEYNLTLTMAKEILNKYGENIEYLKVELEKDPYKALCGIKGIGFKKADEMILNKNPELINSKIRMLSAIEYILRENETNGNTFMYILDCYNKTKEFIPECIGYFTEVLNEKDRFYSDDIKKIIALKNTYEIEKIIAKRLIDGIKIEKNYNFDISKYSKTIDGNDLTEQQMEILNLIKSNTISILSGYAGCGKSSSVNAITAMLKDNGKTFLLLAPTGRASKVLSLNTGESASTIHKLVLKHQFPFPSIIDIDFIVCDEATMIDIFLMRDLLELIDFNKTSIIFVCDPAQLSSVGCGNVLTDMINSNKFPMAFLDKVFRYNEGGISYVATETRAGNCYFNQEIKKGNVSKFGEKNDYAFIEVKDDEINKEVLNIYKKLIGKGQLNINEIIVLSAYNSGKYGTISLNNLIQKLVNPKTTENKTNFSKKVKDTMIEFRIGDRIIQIVNDYGVPVFTKEKLDKKNLEEVIDDGIENTRNIVEEEILDKSDEIPTINVFNGEDGIIVDANDKYLIIEFNGVKTIYNKERMANIMLGYAITIHKSQGSTFNNVITISPSAHTFFSTRNLLYVALTRAKNGIIHIGSKNTVNSALKKNESKSRKTFLNNLLQEF